MKISQAQKNLASGKHFTLEIRPTPGKSGEFFLLLYGVKGKTYILADEEDISISTADINKLLQIGKTIGFKDAKIII
jgi:hypothetical protein